LLVITLGGGNFNHPAFQQGRTKVRLLKVS